MAESEWFFTHNKPDKLRPMAKANSLMQIWNGMDTRSKEVQQAEFLVAYMEDKSLSRAAACARLPITVVNKWRKFDKKFIEAFEEVVSHYVSELEDEAYRRAKEGVLKPIYQGGIKVGEVREYSDSLMIFLLKAADPAKYRDRLIVNPKANNKNNNVLILPSNGREVQQPEDIPSEDVTQEDTESESITE